METFGTRVHDELEEAFAAMTRARAGALLVLPDPILALHIARIVDFAEKSHLPAMYGLREHAAAGGLMAYGPNYADLLSACGHLPRQDSQRRPALPSSRGETHEIRACH